MPEQRFKSVYFADLQETAQTLTLAFGTRDRELFQRISSTSSLDLRQAIGHRSLKELKESARREDRSVNSYCLLKLRDRFGTSIHSSEQGVSYALPLDGLTDLALQATFRGGASLPFQNWYPYLEGYSPTFVETLLQRFAPGAQSVLDPFGGVGTTCLTAARLGLSAYYCEVNPLLQHLVSTKSEVLALGTQEQCNTRRRLLAAANVFHKRLAACKPDEVLRDSYRHSFGSSVFFSIQMFEHALRARTLIDLLSREDPLLARLIEVAILAALVPASLLIKRGDLRFRTEAELAQSPPDRFADNVRRSLERMADDFGHDPVSRRPVMLCEDARALSHVPPHSIDAALTSPPYLNGTNYFRNTKLELWFMRCLTTGHDLAHYRKRAITSGINDVTVSKHDSRIPGIAAKLVERLSKESYDRRIAQMVAGYFQDFEQVAEGLRKQLRRGAPLIIDIGDSSYGGIHVPTDDLLRTLLEQKGFRLLGDYTLRQRASRSGRPLRQAVLVFRNDAPVSVPLSQGLEARWRKQWSTFKRDLPHQQDGYKKRNWGNARHFLCSYQGKMKPSLAHFLVRTFTSPGDSLLDPFAGVGTIPLEAALNGVRSWSFDISPAAINITRAKLNRVSAEEVEKKLAAIQMGLRTVSSPSEKELEAARKIRFNGPLQTYFHEKTFAELMWVRRYFLRHPPVTPAESVIFSSLLHVLHGNRPYALSRRSHPITPFAPSGPTEYRPLMPRLRDKVQKTLAVPMPEDFIPGEVLMQDSSSWWPNDVKDLDAIITSPPFFESTRFHLANWMRLWFCGWEDEDFRTRPRAFIDERQRKDFEVYEPIFRQAKERLKPGGILVLHLGESRKCNMGLHLEKVASHWFRKADLFAESVAHCESHGIRDKGAVTSHQFLLLE